MVVVTTNYKPMNIVSANQHQKLMEASMIIAPVLFGISTFYWQNYEYRVVAATLIVIASVFWIPALAGIFGLLKQQMPWYYAIGLFIALYGASVGSIGFALPGYFSTVFHIPHTNYIKALAAYPVSSGLLIFWPGPLFPLSLLILGINLARKKTITLWLCIMLSLSGMIFPLGRILRIEWVAHITDLLLAIPFVVIGIRFIKEKNAAQ